MASPIPVEMSFNSQKIAVISGTLVAIAAWLGRVRGVRPRLGIAEELGPG